MFDVVSHSQLAWDVAAGLLGCAGARLTIDHRNWVFENVQNPDAHVENTGTYVFAAIYQFGAPAIVLILQSVLAAISAGIGGVLVAKVVLHMLKTRALSFSALLVLVSIIYFLYRVFGQA